jgi:hypothetical protein
MRSCAGATGQPAWYVKGTSVAVIEATTPVNAGCAAAPEVAVPNVAVVAVVRDVVAVVGDVGVDPDVDVDAVGGEVRRAVCAEPDDPHAPVATSINVTTAPAQR